jgi:hypothetical protein
VRFTSQPGGIRSWFTLLVLEPEHARPAAEFEDARLPRQLDTVEEPAVELVGIGAEPFDHRTTCGQVHPVAVLVCHEIDLIIYLRHHPSSANRQECDSTAVSMAAARGQEPRGLCTAVMAARPAPTVGTERCWRCQANYKYMWPAVQGQTRPDDSPHMFATGLARITIM